MASQDVDDVDDVVFDVPEKESKESGDLPAKGGPLEFEPQVLATIVDVVSGMQLEKPELLRAVPAWVVLRNFGQVLRETSLDPGKLHALFSLSAKVPFIKEFWSHSWHGKRSMKIWLLLMLKNGFPAVCVGTFAAFLAAVLSYLEILPGWYKEPRIQGPGYSGEFRYNCWALLSGVLASLLTLLLWRSGDSVFLDRICIHQGNNALKAQAILHLGAFMKSSKRLVVVWDKTYLSRLWCVFELAAFLHSHKDDPRAKLVIKPIAVAPLMFIIVAGGVLSFAFELVLPSSGLVVMVQVVYMLALNLLLTYVLEHFWRDVFTAEQQFRAFRWQEVTCACCSTNHLTPDGQRIACDRVILEECIVEWFGSIEALETQVRTSICDTFLKQVTRGFPFGYLWLLGGCSCILWGQADHAAARAHGGAHRHALSILIATVAWFLWASPNAHLIFGRIARWMQKKQKKKLSAPAYCAVKLAGYLASTVNTAAPLLWQWWLYGAVLDPVLAASAFAGTTLLFAILAYGLLAKPDVPNPSSELGR